MIEDEEDVFDAREQAEAQALARALEGPVVTSVPPSVRGPGDALEVAALLRADRHGNAALAACVVRVGARLDDERRRAETLARRRRAMPLVFGLVAAAAAVVLVVGRESGGLDAAMGMRRNAATSPVASDSTSSPVEDGEGDSYEDDGAASARAAQAPGSDDVGASEMAAGDARRSALAYPGPSPTNLAESSRSWPVERDDESIMERQASALRGDVPLPTLWTLATLDGAMRAPRAAMYAAVVHIASYDPWLARIGSAMRRADSVAPHDARRTLEVAVRLPREGFDASLARAPLQDVYFRLAVLALEAGDPGRALDEAERGLALGVSPDVHVTNLWIAVAAADAALGRRAAAEGARAAARVSLERTRTRR